MQMMPRVRIVGNRAFVVVMLILTACATEQKIRVTLRMPMRRVDDVEWATRIRLHERYIWSI